jgi:hypothetical protein
VFRVSFSSWQLKGKVNWRLLLEATTGNTAVWTEPKTDALMNYFLAEKAKLGDSGVFKKQVFQAAAESI